MITWTMLYLFVVVWAYVVFGGADFGGGSLEQTIRKYPNLRLKLQKTLGPIWEANHVWLIAAVVILFVGFPKAYAKLLTYEFIPVSLALIGIAVRGTFFTLRKYDPEPGNWLKMYSAMFRLSSFLTPFCFGWILGDMMTPIEQQGSWESVGFNLAIGLFTSALFTYLAAVFFFGEVKGEEQTIIASRIVPLFFLVFVVGGVVLGWGYLSHRVTLEQALNPYQIVVQFLAMLSILFVWKSVQKSQSWSLRLWGGFQVSCILSGWWITQSPHFLYTEEGSLTLQMAASPDNVLAAMNWTLTLVLLVVAPALAYLIYLFQKKEV